MNARHREEIEFTLTAVVKAIESGRLPPDDAWAWARIAAEEAALIEPEVWQVPIVQAVGETPVSVS
jgi:hypothetical protein